MPYENLSTSAAITSAISYLLVRYGMAEAHQGPTAGLPEDVVDMLHCCVDHINELERREGQRIDEIESLCSEVERLELKLMDGSVEEQEF